MVIIQLYFTKNMQIFHSHEIDKERNIFNIQTRLIIINSSNDSEDTGGGWHASGASLWPRVTLYQGNSKGVTL